MKKIKKVMATVLLLCMISSMLVVPAAASEITASEISLNFMGKTLAVGGTFQLKAIFEPEGANPAVKWESDNATVASVDETGLVTGLADGTAVITASVYEGQLTAECTVTVVTETDETPIVPVSGISLGEQTSLNLEPNGTAALVATVAPENATNKYVAWVSSDENVATVDEDGLVTAVAPGYATVSAIAADVDLTLPAEQLAMAAIANCAVTVSEPYVEPAPATVPVSGITISSKELVMTLGDVPVTLTAAVNSDASNQNVYWTIDIDTVASVEGGVISPLSAGSATIYAISEENGNIYETCTLTVNSGTVPVSGITISNKELVMTLGDDPVNLSAAVNSDATNQNVYWTIDIDTVASVEGGVISPLSAGSATIYAISEENGNIYETCTLTVNPAAPTTVPVSGITISSKELVMTMGDAPVTLSAAVNSDATNQNVYWTIDIDTVASVEGGVITPLSAGSATIYAISEENGNIYETCTLTVNSGTVPVSGITISNKELVMTLGDAPVTLSAAVNSDATNQNVYWTIDINTVASVEGGVITPLSAGSATIYAISEENGNIYETCTLTVNPAAPTEIKASAVYIDPAVLSLTAGETATINAAVNDEATDKSLYWTVDYDNIAKVENGTVTAISAGTTNVYAVAADGSNVYATCVVTVTEPAPATVAAKSVTLEPNISEFSMKVGEYVDFTASVDAEATDKGLYWVSDDSAVASVENGRVTANGSGRTTIYAVANGDTAYAACTVIVTTEPVAMFASRPGTVAEGGEGGGEQNLTPAPIALSIDGQSVDGTITLDYAENKSFTLTAAHGDEGGNYYSWNVIEGTSVELSEVPNSTKDRTLTIKGLGSAKISVSLGSIVTTTFDVTVNPVPVSSVSLSKTELSLVAGSISEALTATISPSGATNKNVSWISSNTSVATVSGGVVSAVAPGTTTITVKTEDGEKTASCAVTVTPAAVSVSSIAVSPDVTEVINGESVTFTATASPENATNKKVVWSITGGDEFAGDLSYNSDGSVTVRCTEYAASDASSITVTATAEENSSVSGSSSVRVLGVPAVELVCINDWKSLVFNSNEAPFEGLSARLSRGNPVENFVWESSNENVVKVLTTGTGNNANAVIQIMGVGDAEITASYRGVKSSVMPVTVQNNAISITSVTMAGALNLTPGSRATLHATVLPDNATNRTLNWSSDNSYVGVDNNGNVTVDTNAPVDTVAYIKATAADNSGKVGTCKVTVVSNTVPVSNVKIVGSAPRLTVGQTTSLGVTVEPSNATNKTVYWSSENTAIASVDQNGFITAKAAGQTRIIARSVADSSKEAAIDVYVSNAPSSTGTLRITASSQTISTVNGYSALTAYVNGYVIPSGVNWSVSDTSMATVSANGVVTAKRAGSFVVTGIYDNNNTRYSGTILITAAPVITSGNYSNYDGRNVMYFKTNQSYPSWRSTDIVSVDGVVLRHGQHCYVGSSPDGYVMVALNPQYLNTLPSSVVHTIRIGPASSPAVGYFRTYTGQGTVINGVMTGDENQAALWAALCLMGILGCASILISRRKDWNS